MRKQIQLGQQGKQAIEFNGSSLEGGISTRANAVMDRYHLLMALTPCPDLSDPEIEAIMDAHWNSLFILALLDTKGLPAKVSRALEEGLAEKYGIDGPALVAKLDEMPLLLRIRLIEEMEIRRNRG